MHAGSDQRQVEMATMNGGQRDSEDWSQIPVDDETPFVVDDDEVSLTEEFSDDDDEVDVHDRRPPARSPAARILRCTALLLLLLLLITFCAVYIVGPSYGINSA